MSEARRLDGPPSLPMRSSREARDETEALPVGPYTVDGPWGHEQGYPQTWCVRAPGWMLADCPRGDVAEAIAVILNDRAALLARLERTQQEHDELAGLLRRTHDALGDAQFHIRDELQAEFQLLADGKPLTNVWDEPHDQSAAAQRLATWWHGVGTDEILDECAAALGLLGNDTHPGGGES